MKDHLIQDVLQHLSTVLDDGMVDWASIMLHTVGSDMMREQDV
jgi:hypothetical protein